VGTDDCQAALSINKALTTDKKENCLLCGAESGFFGHYRKTDYYRCLVCRTIFIPPAFHLSPEREMKRYQTHNNDVNDPRYRAFVSPLTGMVFSLFRPHHKGLDFGAGPGPVAALQLREKGYDIELYDPFFHDNPGALQKKYDYIVCCEVIEHFRQPQREFRLLRSLLHPGGSLYCMTLLYSEDTDFSKWRYKDDETHIVFYCPGSVSWIKENFGFESALIDDRIIHFKAGTR
jgi:SAM-dependent methyltransferase